MTLLRWLDEDTGLVHLVEGDPDWATIYCMWVLVPRHHELTKDDMPTCIRCVVLAMTRGDESTRAMW